MNFLLFINKNGGADEIQEQVYGSCMGILRLADRYSQIQLEAACRRACQQGVSGYQQIKALIEEITITERGCGQKVGQVLGNQAQTFSVLNRTHPTKRFLDPFQIIPLQISIKLSHEFL